MSTITHMPTARLGRAVADDATASNHTAAYSIIDRLGGGGPGGQLIVRGFFMGIAFGLLVALLFCCWYPWLHMRHRDRRRAVRRLLLRMNRPRRFRRRRREEHELATETAQAQTQTEAEEGTATIMTTATGRATTSAAGAAAAP
ncbi:hypothetical protein LEL_02300 [Akanthomyces lecanii RCEF 1005]|uniref:Transmembrane protein n=1 Tax=Akanthomyces lecanii RCEF 1005 TaxID=1081108 RepID=A0A168I643_CORDF|nr:hypothetical protein LEL_02300 [Akanthomyces lecanii RCEF 1005]